MPVVGHDRSCASQQSRKVMERPGALTVQMACTIRTWPRAYHVGQTHDQHRFLSDRLYNVLADQKLRSTLHRQQAHSARTSQEVEVSRADKRDTRTVIMEGRRAGSNIWLSTMHAATTFESCLLLSDCGRLAEDLLRLLDCPFQLLVGRRAPRHVRRQPAPASQGRRGSSRARRQRASAALSAPNAAKRTHTDCRRVHGACVGRRPSCRPLRVARCKSNLLDFQEACAAKAMPGRQKACRCRCGSAGFAVVTDGWKMREDRVRVTHYASSLAFMSPQRERRPATCIPHRAATLLRVEVAQAKGPDADGRLAAGPSRRLTPSP
eukprot:scaffold420_cov404-Prasinococcus_capsulatus_cf.AAC.2